MYSNDPFFECTVVPTANVRYAVSSIVASMKVVAEYWWFVLFGTIVFGLASFLDQAVFGGHSLFWATCTLVFLMPYVAVAVRRLHDTNRNG